MNIVSLFSGAGGLDKGFEAAGFKTIWANDSDKDVWDTFAKNFPHTYLDQRSIVDVPSEEIPDAVGIIGGPPCQSWSEAGTLRGIDDHRGQLFFEFVRILRDKQPLFFLAENVSGMLSKRHSLAFQNIKNLFEASGYNLAVELLNAADYCVPQDRKRVFFIGIRNDLAQTYHFPAPRLEKKLLQDAIWDLKGTALPAKAKNHSNKNNCQIENHEFLTGGFSSIYMSRNRVRNWHEVSFTIQAGGRHAPIHPQAPKMISVGKDKRIFFPEKEHLYRRLSVRECARIQTFPDDYIFDYNSLLAGYKMVGNAVPCKLAYFLAQQLMNLLVNEKVVLKNNL